MPLFPGTFRPWQQEIHKTASYTAVLADSGTLFVFDSGTCTLTLPALASGAQFICWGFNVSATAMAVAAPSGKLIGLNNAAGTTCTYSTASNIIGSMFCVWMNDLATFYHVLTLGGTPTMS